MVLFSRRLCRISEAHRRRSPPSVGFAQQRFGSSPNWTEIVYWFTEQGRLNRAAMSQVLRLRTRPDKMLPLGVSSRLCYPPTVVASTTNWSQRSVNMTIPPAEKDSLTTAFAMVGCSAKRLNDSYGDIGLNVRCWSGVATLDGCKTSFTPSSTNHQYVAISLRLLADIISALRVVNWL